MCTHCGCSSEKAVIFEPAKTRGDESVNHQHLSLDKESIHLQQALLAGNDAIAGENRRQFQRQHINCVNLMGTPGAGKTLLLEHTVTRIRAVDGKVAVLEGDQQTSNDAKRIQAAGAPVLQINTGTGCHLDADMVKAGVKQLQPDNDSLLFVENVGNLVCPALFDLGETARVAMMALTDGEDKPLKYPHMFRYCDLVIINKMDLAPWLDVDMATLKTSVAKINPNARVLCLSAKTGEGLHDWLHWLGAEHRHA